MMRKWTFRYTGAAIIAGALIIAVALIANPSMLPTPTYAKSNFLVMLTDPPTVPAGTTQLNLTYTGLAIHVSYPNGTTEWLPITGTGTENLFSLINVTKTIAATSIPINSTVDKIQFTIANVTAEINSQVYNVTALSDTFVVQVTNTKVNQTLSGVLVDFNPTLVQIQAQDVNGTAVNYYVLVPSANAMVVNDVTQDHIKVGTVVKLGENNKVRIVKVQQEFEHNITIVTASLAVNGNSTSLSVTLKNNGNAAFKIFGLTLHGEFNATRTQTITKNHDDEERKTENIHPETLPFKVSDTQLVPRLGNGHDDDDDHFDNGVSALILQPGESVTVSFTGVITLQTESHRSQNNALVITPIADSSYTIRLSGEGSQTFTVKTAP